MARCWAMHWLPDPLSLLRTACLPDFRGMSSYIRVGVGRVKVKQGGGEGGFAGSPGSPCGLSRCRAVFSPARSRWQWCAGNAASAQAAPATMAVPGSQDGLHPNYYHESFSLPLFFFQINFVPLAVRCLCCCARMVLLCVADGDAIVNHFHRCHWFSVSCGPFMKYMPWEMI